jgi:hypothetical protein
MTERDSGRYDAITDTWIDQQVKVDFAWGNIPMQPDADRAMFHHLDPALDSHIIATSGYEGFPAFITGGVYDDTIANVVVPDVVTLTEGAATTALTNAGLVKGAVTTADNAAGATSGNTGKVKTQTPAAGTTVNTGSSVALVKYAYVAPVTTGSISGINRTAAGTSFSLNGTDAIMYLLGRTVKPTVGWTITLAGTTNATHNVNWTVAGVENNDSYNTGGTAVKITLVTGTFTGATSTGGTWTKV